ncbi:hypothetical protein CCP3SC1AL1_2210010 [Gammaproteobacteria bacterium]
MGKLRFQIKMAFKIKYKRQKGNGIDEDYRYYLGKEGIYHALFGHKLTEKQRRKRDYIWKSLLKQEGIR